MLKEKERMKAIPYTSTIGHMAITWRSVKQSCIAIPTREVKYNVVPKAEKEAMTQSEKLRNHWKGNNEGMTNKWNANSIQVLVGLVTRARAKKFKETLNGLIQNIWAEVNSWRPKEDAPHVPQEEVDLKFLMKALMGEMRRVLRAGMEQVHEQVRVEDEEYYGSDFDEKDNRDSIVGNRRYDRRFREARNREDNNLDSIKMKIPSFQGKNNAKAYFEWDKKVFDCHTYSELKKKNSEKKKTSENQKKKKGSRKMREK
ncbi:hypothetical protein AAG906_017835 [Vitis piasezkii]